MISFKATILGILLAWIGHTIYNHLHAGYINLSSTCDHNGTFNSYFSMDYYNARTQFKSYAQMKNLKLYNITIEKDNLDLTIDVAIKEGRKDTLLIHISGTHGVEGFAGSAIQSAILHNDYVSQDPNSPTILFIHALNPYGFSQLRRWNENNVDLNRNFMSKEEFEAIIKRDPNEFGYVDVYDIINPPKPIDWTDFFWLKLPYNIIKHGYQRTRRALVTGNYHFPKSLFYGGQELQPSLVKITEFLKQNLNLNLIKNAIFIDIHTGLGSSGYDTLFIGNSTLKDQLYPWINESIPGNIISSDVLGESALQGYNDVKGIVPEGLKMLLPYHSTTIPITQEFGTVPGILVFKALREESAMYHHSPSYRLISAQNVRDVFYLHHNCHWKYKVVERGTTLFKQSISYLHTISLNS